MPGPEAFSSRRDSFDPGAHLCPNVHWDYLHDIADVAAKLCELTQGMTFAILGELGELGEASSRITPEHV